MGNSVKKESYYEFSGSKYILGYLDVEDKFSSLPAITSVCTVNSQEGDAARGNGSSSSDAEVKGERCNSSGSWSNFHN